MAKENRKHSGPRLGSTAAAAILLAVVIAGSVLLGAVSQSAEGVPSSEAEGLIRFSEVMTSNASTMIGEDNSLCDWIELVNRGDRDFNLNGYALMLNGDPTKLYRFDPKVVVPAEGRLLLYADGEPSRAGEVHLPFKLPASGVEISMLNPSGDVMSQVEVPMLEANWVYCTDDGGRWQKSAVPTPGMPNRIGEKSVDALSGSVVEGAVMITEIMSRNATYCPDELGEYHDFIELTNFSEQEVNLMDWHLSDDKGNIAMWKFPEVILPAGESMVVYCSGFDRRDDPEHLHTCFRLGGDGTSVLLTRSDGQIVSLVDVPALEADQSYSRIEERWTDDFPPTPGRPNNVQEAVVFGEQVLKESGSDVILSEISASSTTVNSDWIELYNNGSKPVDLSGYGLSDNASRPRKWQFPEGTVIQPGQYMGVLCSGLDGMSSGQQHTNFKLSAEGGYSVTLSDPEGRILDRAFVPQQYQDVTYGRVPDQEGFYFFDTATPLSPNNGVPYYGKMRQPEYSTRGGLFRSGETVTVSITADPGAKVYYTLDNTDPTEMSTPYTEPITITGTTILRTRVYADHYLESFSDTQSYLYDVQTADGIFVVSLVSDPDNLVSEEKGIMIKGPNASSKHPYKGANFWQDWEHEAHVEIYDSDGGEVLSSGCGVKLHGQYSRAEKQQAFKVIARTEYGTNRFPVALFSKRDYPDYQSFLLRSSGQDTDKVRMRDSVLCALAEGTSVMYQETEICVMYLDGQYWGHYNLRERINADSICQFEGWEGDEDVVDIVKANTNTMQGSNETFDQFLKWVKKTDPRTEEFYEGVDRAIDIRNYMEYMAVQIFVGNGDTLNVKRYRNANEDGKWRWVLFDLDWAFVVDTNSINRWLTPGGMGTNLYTDNTLFIACMKNPRFRDEFLTYMGQQMATTFSSENVIRLIMERYEILKPILPAQLARWRQTEKSYQQELDFMINYAKERPMKLMGYFSTTEYLKLTMEDMYHYFGDAREVALNFEP